MLVCWEPFPCKNAVHAFPCIAALRCKKVAWVGVLSLIDDSGVKGGVNDGVEGLGLNAVDT